MKQKTNTINGSADILVRQWESGRLARIFASLSPALRKAALMLLLAVMSTTTLAQSTLMLNVDYCKAGVGTIHIAGWVYDNDPNTKLSWELGHGIEVFAFVSTDPNEVYEGYYPIPHEPMEYIVRDDVNAAFGLTGYHGFINNISLNPYIYLFCDDEGDISERIFYVKIYVRANFGNGFKNYLKHSLSVTVRKNLGFGSEDNPYLITDAGDWNSIADAMADKDIGQYFSGSYYQMDEYYDNTTPVIKMFGTATQPFTGHFNGNGQTLNVNLSGDMHVAPFAFTNGATIQDLTVAGNISASRYAGGIVGHGGSSTLTLQNCVCSATISGFQNYAGGLLGWCDDLTLNFQNCLFKGSFSPGNGGKYHPIALKNANKTVTMPPTITLYYVNTKAPSEGLGNNIIARANGTPISVSFVDGVWDEPVTATDGQPYYAAHFNGHHLPYEYGFENNDLSAEGWTMVDCVPGTMICDNNDAHHNIFYSPNCTKIQAHSSDYHYLISPEFNGHSSITVSLEYQRGTGSYGMDNLTTFQVGYSTTTNDIEAFAWDDPITETSNKWKSCEKDFPKGTKFIAIKIHPTICSLLLDNFSFRACNYPSPTHLSAIDVTEDTASPSWDVPVADHVITGYSYQSRKIGDEDWSDEIQIPATSTSATFNNLTANTDYEFRVKALYGDDGESIFMTTRFTTAKVLPYEWGFENGMDRWSMVNYANDAGDPLTKICPEAKNSGANGFMFYSYVISPQYLISPRFAGTTELKVSFYYKDRRPDSGFWETFQVGYSVTTSDIDAFIWSEDIYATAISWTKAEHTFPVGTKFIAIKYVSSYTKGLYLDDFSFEEKSNFEEPTNLTVSELTNHSITLAWTASNGATGYAYQYKKPTDDVWSAEATTATASVIISGLVANTTYDFRVRALYAGDNASNYVTARFLTEGAAVTSLPYLEGFENGMGGWRISGILSGIRWDTSFSHDGNNSFDLYQHEALISPQLDVSTPMSVSFYYKHFYGTYNDGMNQGTSEFPASFQVGYSKTTKDLNAFAWGGYIKTSAEWQEFSFFCPEGTKYVAVKWQSDYDIYLDDFTFTVGTPPSVPHDIAVTNITALSADLSWAGDSERYDVRFRRKPLFFEDFESGLGQWKVVRNGEGTDNTDWSQVDLAEGTEYWATGHSGTYVAMSIGYDYETDIVYAVDNWLVSPQVTLDGTLSFWVHDSGNSHEPFDVYVSTTSDEVSSFTKIGSGVSTDRWTAFTFDLSSYNGVPGYFAIRHQSEGNPFFAVDDVGISKGNLAWITGTTRTNVRCQLYNLSAETEYEFQVRSIIYNTLSAWSDVVTFTTNRTAPIYDDEDNNEVIDIMADITNATFDVMLVGRKLYKDGTWNTLCLPFGVGNLNGTPLEGATVKTLGSTDLSNDGTLTLNFTDATGIEAGKPYILKWDLPTPDLVIHSAAEWEAFAQNVNNGTESYEGKLVQLATDISISTMAGTADHPFCGTFEGAGYTLNLSISGADYAAPFRYINGATICNVKVTGSVNGGQYSAGIVGAALGGKNSIRNCWMAALVSGQTYVGGILGHGTTSATTISNCFLDGSLNASYIGVLYGGGSNGGTHAVENCWARGTYPTILFDGGIDLVLADGGTVSVTNCRQNIGQSAQGTPEGTIVVVGEGNINSYFAEFLGGQWALDDNVGLAMSHATDATNITSPVFKKVRVSSTITPVGTDHVNFIGITSPATLAADDGSLLYLDTDKTLHHPDADMTLNACRGYFQLNNPGATINAIVLNFGDIEILLGDVNGDDKVTPADAIMILYHYFGVIQNGFNKSAADLNGDKQVTPADAIEALYKYFGASAGARSSKPANSRDPE